MIRRNELIDLLGTPVSNPDSPTEQLKSFINYLADNYSANENGGIPIEEAIFIARKQIGEAVIDRREKQNIDARDGNLLSNGQAYGLKGNWTMGFFLRHPRDAVQFLAVQAKQEALRKGDQAAANKFGALAEGLHGKRQAYDVLKTFQGRRTNDMVNIERRYIGGGDAVNAAFNRNKAGFFDRIFRRTSRQYKDFEKEFKAYREGSRIENGTNTRDADRQSVERTAKAYLQHKIPDWNGEGLPTMEQINALSGKSKNRAMFCFNVLSATKDSEENEQKLTELVAAVEVQMVKDGTSLATNRIYEANSTDANEIKSMLNNVAPIESIFPLDGKTDKRELTNAQKHFQQSLAKDLEVKTEGVDVQRLSKDVNDMDMVYDDPDMSVGN